MTSREARLARNEALFRGVNERIKDVRSAEADPVNDAVFGGDTYCIT